ncbi:MAG: molybdenum cofactor guanylyltransferase [Flavobacteriales bacterium]
MIKSNKITGVILAGGKSKRMGEDKGLMELNGKRMVEYPIETLREFVHGILIIANKQEYQTIEKNVVPDMYTDRGPLCGIVTAMHNARTPWIMVMPCDTPYVKGEVLERLLETGKDAEISITEHHRIEPLIGLYSTSVLSKMECLMNKGYRRMIDVVDHFNTKRVSMNRIMEKYEEDLFVNVNTYDQVNSYDN